MSVPSGILIKSFIFDQYKLNLSPQIRCHSRYIELNASICIHTATKAWNSFNIETRMLNRFSDH